MNKEVFNRIKIKLGDITQENADAIVNAANSSLLGGGGVDGAIHRAAGSELLTESASLGGCLPGGAKVTKGYRLPANFVIHAVGPIWRGGNHDEEKTLADAYRNSLEQAVKIGARTVAFPAISTGVYAFSKKLAAEIAVRAVADFLDQHGEINEVRLVSFSKEAQLCHAMALQELINSCE